MDWPDLSIVPRKVDSRFSRSMLLPDGTEHPKFFWDQPSTQRLSICGRSDAYWVSLSMENPSSLETLLSIKSRKFYNLLVDLLKKILSRSSHRLPPTSLPAPTFPRKKPSPPCSPWPLRMPLTCSNTCWSSTLFIGTRQLRLWLTDMSKIFMMKLNRLCAKIPSVTVESI